MMEQLARDIETAPDLFGWTGPVPRDRIEAAIEQAACVVPEALVDLWEKYGVLDMFESETILSPIHRDHDNIAEVNETLRERGMPRRYLVFHTGLYLTAIRQPDGAIVQLDEERFVEDATYASLEDWYERGIGSLYRDRYGLPPAAE